MSKTRNHIADGCKIPVFIMLGRLRRLCDAQIQCFARNVQNIAILLTNQEHCIKPTLFIIEKWIIKVELSTEFFSSTSRNLRMKIPLTDPVLIRIQIWQPLIAPQNILDCSEYLLVSNRSRITKQSLKRVSGCWENRKFPRYLRILARGGSRSKSPALIRAADCFLSL